MLDLVGQVGTQLGRVVERNRAREHMAHHALHDPLTGLPNRALFLDRLSSALALGRRTACTGRAVHRPRPVQGRQRPVGHAAGDELLMAVGSPAATARCAPATPWPASAATSSSCCARTSTTRRGARGGRAHLLELLRRAATRADGQRVLVPASIGIALADRRRADPEALLRDADTAMYRAKERGRNRNELFDRTCATGCSSRARASSATCPGARRDQLRAPLPADRRAGAGEPRRRRGAGPLGAPRAAACSPRRVHPAGRGDGLIVPHRRLGAGQRLPPGARAGGRARPSAAAAGHRQPLRPPARDSRPGRRPGPARSTRDRPRPRATCASRSPRAP